MRWRVSSYSVSLTCGVGQPVRAWAAEWRHEGLGVRGSELAAYTGHTPTIPLARGRPIVRTEL